MILLVGSFYCWTSEDQKKYDQKSKQSWIIGLIVDTLSRDKEK
jgi:hypothetical protein